MSDHKATPQETQKLVLAKSRGRCAICFGFTHDLKQVGGQLTQIDPTQENEAEDNLVFLCFKHHDQYSSGSKLQEEFTQQEVSDWKDQLETIISLRERYETVSAEIVLSTDVDELSKEDEEAFLRNLRELTSSGRPISIEEKESDANQLTVELNSRDLADLMLAKRKGLMEHLHVIELRQGQSATGSDTSLPELIMQYVRVLTYTRYSILSGILLAALGYVVPFLPLQAVTAIYVMNEQPWRLFFTAWLSMMAAALVIATFRTTLCNAADRFEDDDARRIWEAPTRAGRFLRKISIWIFGPAIPIACLMHSGVLGGNWPWLVFQLVLGFSAAVVSLYFFYGGSMLFLTPNLFQRRTFPLDFGWLPILGRYLPNTQDLAESRLQDSQDRPVKRTVHLFEPIAKILSKLGLKEGYVEWRSIWILEDGKPKLKSKLVLASGHFSLMFMTTVMLAFYFIAYKVIKSVGNFPDEDRNFGTLFFAVGILMLITATLPAISFFLDRFRYFPPLIVLSLLVGLISSCNPRHEFEVIPEFAGGKSEQDLSRYESEALKLEDVINGWKERQKGSENKTFVIVTAAGGGIQAAGWTTEVLRGLEEDVDGGFAKSIGVISAVSGGSVGTLCYLSQYPELIEDGANKADLMNYVHEQSTKSSLESVAWGFMFPDAMRCFGLMRDPFLDRGAVQESVWRNRMERMQISKQLNTGTLTSTSEYPRSDWRFGHLADGVKQARLPAVVFNTFLIDTGQRVWMAPFTVRDYDRSASDVASQDPSVYASPILRRSHDFVEYAHAEKSMGTRLATAVRLSATFPYVSPTVTPDKTLQSDSTTTGTYLRNMYFGDGGYTDNEGLLTALYLAELVAEYASKQDPDSIDRILLVRIAPFPVGRDIKDNGEYQKRMKGKEKRSSRLVQSIAGPGLGLYNGRQTTQTERGELEVDWFSSKFSSRFKDIAFESVLLDFYLEKKNKKGEKEPVSPPLSWKLLDYDIENLSEAWKVKSKAIREKLPQDADGIDLDLLPSVDFFTEPEPPSK